jgi:hypothetical protein
MRNVPVLGLARLLIAPIALGLAWDMYMYQGLPRTCTC